MGRVLVYISTYTWLDDLNSLEAYCKLLRSLLDPHVGSAPHCWGADPTENPYIYLLLDAVPDRSIGPSPGVHLSHRSRFTLVSLRNAPK